MGGIWLGAMGFKKLYVDIYAQFLEKYRSAKGYDFQHGGQGSAAPKPVTFKEKLKWWTLDRPQRLKKISQDRDRRQQEILALNKHQAGSPSRSSHP